MIRDVNDTVLVHDFKVLHNSLLLLVIYISSFLLSVFFIGVVFVNMFKYKVGFLKSFHGVYNTLLSGSLFVNMRYFK